MDWTHGILEYTHQLFCPNSSTPLSPLARITPEDSKDGQLRKWTPPLLHFETDALRRIPPAGMCLWLQVSASLRLHSASLRLVAACFHP